MFHFAFRLFHWKKYALRRLQKPLAEESPFLIAVFIFRVSLIILELQTLLSDRF